MFALPMVFGFLKNYALQIAIVAALLGAWFWVNHAAYERGWAAREQVAIEAQREITKANAQESTRSAALDRTLTAEIDRGHRRSADLKQALRTHLTTADTKDPNAQLPSFGRTVLDADTVRLLNDARGLPGLPAAVQLDAKGAAPAAADVVTGTDLAVSDADLAARYQDLARRHDALVEYGLDYQKRLDAQAR